MKPFLIIGGFVVLGVALTIAGINWFLAIFLSAFINGVVMALAEELTGDY